ncbi:Protein of unknown function [Clostridium collagenovorans DSM 3089]|uniref:DUF3955 domain-containing protein n=1 Tax=Clostridium collagenovorans DSM 3089 TaxID=1121306 RepID=A0A1M5V0K8_9CLOT|nr:Protein of unknown function [Clostridium collagenovorans DSM 3089]
MKKYIYVLPFILGICCFIISEISGATISPNGMLIEPFFFLIPIGYMFLFIGIIISFINFLCILYKKVKKA